MAPKDYGQKLHLTRSEHNLRKDRKVPDCDYCADPMFWSCSQVTGNFKGLTGKCEGFPDKKGCAPESVTTRSNMFTLHPKSEGGSCFLGDEVAALMTDRETFFKFQSMSDTGDITMTTGGDLCITSADLTSFVDGNPVLNYFSNGKIDACMILSWIIGALAAFYVPTAIHRLFKFGRTNYMLTLILQDRDALADFRHILKESKRFAVISQSDKQEGNPLKGARVLRHLNLEHIHPHRSMIQRFTSFLGRSGGHKHPKGKTLQIAQIVTRRWLDMSLDLANLEVDDGDGKLKVQNVWDYEKNRLADDAHIICLPENYEESQMNVDEEWSVEVRDRFKRLQQVVVKIAHLLERLQIELNVFFFLGSAITSRAEIDDQQMEIIPPNSSQKTEVTSPESSPVPTYWREIGEKVRFFTEFESLVQELQYISLVFVFGVVPLLCLYCWVVNLFYAALLEKGLAVFGLKSDVEILQEYTVWIALVYFASSFLAVASFYYLRTKLWWSPAHACFSVEENTIKFGNTHTWYGNTHTWYKRHMFMSRFSIIFVFGLGYGALSFMVTVTGLWLGFGMLLEPAKVAAYFSAMLGLVGHITSMALRMKGFLEDCKTQLKEAIEIFEDKLLSPKKDIQKHEIERLLRKFGFSVEDVVVAVVGTSPERNERDVTG
jgi:hypothetical protein